MLVIMQKPKDKDAEKSEPSCTVGKNIKLCNDCGKQYESSSKIYN